MNKLEQKIAETTTRADGLKEKLEVAKKYFSDALVELLQMESNDEKEVNDYLHMIGHYMDWHINQQLAFIDSIKEVEIEKLI
jgi:hypothetical protein